MKKKGTDQGEIIYGTLEKKVIESYIMANSRHSMSIYGERLLLKLVEIAQSQILGLDFKGGSGLTRIDPYSLDPVVEVNISELLGENGSANYTYAKRAVLDLLKVHHEHERPKFNKYGEPELDSDGRQILQYEAHQLVNDVTVNDKPGTIIIDVNKKTWQGMLDFSKGFRRYDLILARKLRQECSLRMYKLVSEQKTPLTFSIDELRLKFGLEDKYKQNYDMFGVLDRAKKELDACSPWTFDYEKLYSLNSEENKGRRGRKACTAIRIHPIHQIKFEALDARKSEVSPRMMFGSELHDLFKKFEFSDKELTPNMELIIKCRKEFADPDIFKFLMDLAPKAFRADDPKGYVIGSLKKHLAEKYHYYFEKGKVIRKQPDLFDGIATAMAGQMKAK